MDKRLMNLLKNRGRQIKDGCMIDTYNQQIQYDVSCTIRTNINTANHHFIIELCDTKEKHIDPYEGFYWNTTQKFFRGQLGGGISRCVKTDDSLAVMEEVKIAAMRGRNPENPSERGKSNGKYQQRLEINENETSNTITSVQKDNLVIEPKIIKEGNYSPSGHNASSIVNANGISPAVMENHGTVTAVVVPQDTATTICLNSKVDGKQPSLEHRIYDSGGISTAITTGFHPSIVEPLNPYKDGLSATDVVQIGNSYIGSTEECSSCITSACGAGGGMTPMLTDAPLETEKTKEFFEQVRGHAEMRYRIRKLTTRECFRLMGVDDADIDKIQASGISNSQQYKCAGNSIVVDVLYHLFRKMFVETENESQQQSLF